MFALRKSEELDFDLVLKDGTDQKFDSFTPESLRGLAVEQEVVNIIHEQHGGRFNM